jgi:hypothetical protein
LTADEEAVRQAVTVAATVSVTASVAVSITTTIATSVASTSAGGAASGGASSASGGLIAPILLGAQRFSATSQLAVSSGNLQASVGDSMAWAAGELSWFGGASDDSDELDEQVAMAGNNTSNIAVHSFRSLLRMERVASRRLQQANPPRELISLLNIHLTLLAALGFAVIMHLCVVALWRHRVNRSYYKYCHHTTESKDPSAPAKLAPPKFMP